jgi:hypothetical protein
MSENETAPISKGARIGGWVLSVLPCLLLLMSATFKFLQPGPDFEKGLEEMGWTSSTMFKLGFVEIACTLLYLIPRTSVIGAILVTAYLGGAVATHLRIGQPFFIPIVLGVLVWGGLYLRDTRVRRLLPLS